MTRRHRRNHSPSVCRSPFSTNHKAIQWLFSILTCQTLIRNRFTSVLLKRWNKFSEQARSIQGIRKHEAGGPKKRMLLISVSAYTSGWRILHGPRTDWRLWAMLGTMSGWNVELVTDSLPNTDLTRYPTKENIWRFAQAHLKGNRKADQFIIVYSGHCDDQGWPRRLSRTHLLHRSYGDSDALGLVLADGTHISPQELRDWFVKPLVSGSLLWAFFDCCASSNLLGLRHKVLCNENQGIQYQSQKGQTENWDRDARGTVISIGSSASNSGEMNLNDPTVIPSSNSEPLQCGPLAWAAYYFFHFVCKEGEPLLAKFLPFMKDVLASGEGQEAQITTSTILQDPVLPFLRPLPSTATST